MRSRTQKASYPAVLHLIAYGFAIALPLLFVMGALLWQSGSYERDQSRQQILRVLEVMKDSLDRDLDRHLTILQTLAVSSALQKEDWALFYEEAKAALHGRSYVVLVDAVSGCRTGRNPPLPATRKLCAVWRERNSPCSPICLPVWLSKSPS
jgi:sensor domain CHASE-containing protein